MILQAAALFTIHTVQINRGNSKQWQQIYTVKSPVHQGRLASHMLLAIKHLNLTSNQSLKQVLDPLWVSLIWEKYIFMGALALHRHQPMAISNQFKSWGAPGRVNFLELCALLHSALLLGKHWQSTRPEGASCSLSPDNSCKIKHSHILSSAGFYLMLPFTLIKNILKSSKEEKLVFPTSIGGVFPFSLADCCQLKSSLCSPWEHSELIPEPGKLLDIRTTTTSVVRVFTSAACKLLLLLPGRTKIKT